MGEKKSEAKSVNLKGGDSIGILNILIEILVLSSIL